jgi:hypothetical protein
MARIRANRAIDRVIRVTGARRPATACMGGRRATGLDMMPAATSDSVSPAMTVDVEELYRQHLSDSDRRLLRSIGADNAGLSRALAAPALEAAVFAGDVRDGTLVATSPFLTFAVAVHRTAARLETASFVEERWAQRQRIPVFDVAPLRDLLAAPVRRFFLVELLASYTHVASGATWERTRRGWRRHRFSELDPVRFAGLLEVVEPAERSGIYRRLGDLALFLTGVFPDHRSVLELGGVPAARLLRLSGLPPADGVFDGPGILEYLGARWYRMAALSARAQGATLTGTMAVAEDISKRFDDSRRALNVVTDRYLFPLRERWFGVG